jgi:hypothetical protein
MIEPATVTADVGRAVRRVCGGEQKRRTERPLAHRRVRRHVRQRLHACPDYDGLWFGAKRLTGWVIW